jgi:hypothetical protein
VNPLLIPTLLLTLALFVLGQKISQSYNSRWLAAGFPLAAMPAIVFAAYYTKIFGEAKWLYLFRSWPFTELSAAGIGLIAGWLQHQRSQRPQLKRIASPFLIPFLTVLCVGAPYLKQMVLRLDWAKFENRWDEEVCLQSSESSCGPAAAATLLRHFGKNANELEIARASFTTRRGTENWYLIRAIRQLGLEVDYAVLTPGLSNALFPSIAGVRLNQTGNSGHFITLLAKDGESFIVGDPLDGHEKLTRQEMEERYTFTGFYLMPNVPAASK